MPEGATGNEYRCTEAEAEPISDDDLRSVAFCKNFISYSLFFISVREKERKREKYLEGGPEGEHRAPSTGAEAEAQSDLRSAICDEGRAAASRRCDCGFLGLVCWGLVSVCVLGIFIFYFL